jgi:hypothetical protein
MTSTFPRFPTHTTLVYGSEWRGCGEYTKYRNRVPVCTSSKSEEQEGNVWWGWIRKAGVQFPCHYGILEWFNGSRRGDVIVAAIS